MLTSFKTLVPALATFVKSSRMAGRYSCDSVRYIRTKIEDQICRGHISAYRCAFKKKSSICKTFSFLTIKGMTLIGNGPDVLKKVSMVANDMKLDDGVGTCGKEGQSVPVGVGQPTLKIDDITVGGTEV